MRIVVINMVESSERRKTFFEHADKFPTLRNRIQVFDAVSKNNPIQLNELKTKYNVKIGNPGEAGCALSHILVLEEFIASNDDYCVVFEDDAKIVSDAFLNVQTMLNEISKSSFHMLYLGGRINHNIDFEPCGGWGTEGYIVSHAGAKMLFDILTRTPLRRPIDNQIQSHIKAMKHLHYCKKPDIDFINAYRAKTLCVKHHPNGTSCIGRHNGHWLLGNEK